MRLGPTAALCDCPSELGRWPACGVDAQPSKSTSKIGSVAASMYLLFMEILRARRLASKSTLASIRGKIRNRSVHRDCHPERSEGSVPVDRSRIPSTSSGQALRLRALDDSSAGHSWQT